MASQDQDDLSSKAKLALQLLTKLCECPRAPLVGSSGSDTDTYRISLEDALERYHLWAGNLGALLPFTDSRSLEHRLRNTPAVRQRVLELISGLIELLQNPALNEATDHEAAHEPMHDAPQGVDEALANELLDLTTSAQCQEAWVVAAISDIIARLFKVAMRAAKFRARDDYARAEASKADKFEDRYDIMHATQYVKSRGGKAVCEQWLLERLGKAITRRREFFRYCQEHKQKLSLRTPQMAKAEAVPHEARVLRSAMSKTLDSHTGPVATLHARTSAVHTAATTLVPGADLVDTGFDDTDASTVATSVCFDQGPNALRIPNLAEFGTPGVPFECPYCHRLQKFNGQRGWR